MTAELPVLRKAPTRKHIFISYASADRPVVAALHQRLKDDYLPVWIDNLDVIEGLKAGHPWREGLAEALHAAMCVVWMASPASIRSKWVRAELRRALDLGKPILPYVLDADFENQAEWHDVKAWTTLEGEQFDGLQRIVPAKLGEELAYEKLANQLRKQVRGAKRTGTGFPSSDLEIPISGRDDDLRKVEALLREQCRLVVVTGIGGCGKTRLAAEIANRQRHFAHGVIWHKIEPQTRAEDLTAQIRDHLVLDPKTPSDEVWSALGRHSVLVVLDNGEACADIPAHAERLKTYDLSNGTRFLMTSRFQWHETRLINRAHELGLLTLDAAAQLVRDMAAHHGGPARLNGREAELAQAARLHPRLIQYAVAWLNDFPIGEVLTMLRTLKGGADIEAVMQDILYKTLAQIEAQPNGAQAVADLKKLLVCRGGFTSAAADALLGESSRTSRETLRRWSLLKLDGERYTPDTLVEAALTPDASVCPAHFNFYLALAKAHHARQDYAGLDAESANLAAAFDWALDAGEGEKALALLNASYEFLLNRGRVRAFATSAERVAAALSEHPNRLIWADAQNMLGIAHRELSYLENRAANLHHAVACFQIALEYCTPESASLNYAATQSNLGTTYWILANLEERATNLRRAIECYQHALQYFTPESAPLSYAATQNNLGVAYNNLADLGDCAANLHCAIECYKRALEYRTPESAPLDYAATQNNLGNAYNNLAELENRAANLHHAANCFQAALTHYTPASAPLDHAMAQNNLGIVFSNLADIEERAANLHRAIKRYQAALDYYTPESVPSDYATAQNNLGIAHYKLADVEERATNLRCAVECYQRALVHWTPESAPLDHARAQYNLGLAYEALGNKEEARAAFQEAAKFFRQMGDIISANDALRQLEDLEDAD